jgi:hypothetical protein
MSSVPARFTKLRRLLAESARSRFAWLIVLLHAAWFLLTIANMHPPSREFGNWLEHAQGSTVAIFAGRPFHYSYESLALQLLTLFDLPSELASVPIGFCLTPLFRLFRFGIFEGSYVGAAVILVMSSLQWLIMGKFAHGWLSSRAWGVSALNQITRHFLKLAILILLITAVSAPLLNARSRRLESRHAAISHH